MSESKSVSPAGTEKDKLLGGTLRLFLAESLLFPTGLLIAAFLGRHLNPAGYGLFTLTVTTVTWTEWGIVSFFSRATIKAASEAADWRGVGAAALRLYLGLGVGAALLLYSAAGWLAAAFAEPSLVAPLRLFAFDVPLFCVAQAHRALLIGTGNYRGQSVASGARWISRAFLIIVIVAWQPSVMSALAGSMLGALVEVIVYRLYNRPPLWGANHFPLRHLLQGVLPLTLFALSMRLFDKMDLYFLKLMGVSTTVAGFYGAAQNLTLAPSLFALSFSPLLLSTLSRLRREGKTAEAKSIGGDALRFIMLLFPLAGLLAGCAPEIVGVIFGPAFLPAAPIFALLIFASLALLIISATTAMLLAANQTIWIVALGAPLPVLAAFGHLWLIPKFGAGGASLVTTVITCLGASAGLAFVYYHWQVRPRAATCLRVFTLSVLAYFAGSLWLPQTAGLLLIVKLMFLTVALFVALMMLGEFNANERALLRSLLPVRKFRTV